MTSLRFQPIKSEPSVRWWVGNNPATARGCRLCPMFDPCHGLRAGGTKKDVPSCYDTVVKHDGDNWSMDVCGLRCQRQYRCYGAPEGVGGRGGPASGRPKGCLLETGCRLTSPPPHWTFSNHLAIMQWRLARGEEDSGGGGDVSCSDRPTSGELAVARPVGEVGGWEKSEYAVLEWKAQRRKFVSGKSAQNVRIVQLGKQKKNSRSRGKKIKNASHKRPNRRWCLFWGRGNVGRLRGWASSNGTAEPCENSRSANLPKWLLVRIIIMAPHQIQWFSDLSGQKVRVWLHGSRTWASCVANKRETTILANLGALASRRRKKKPKKLEQTLVHNNLPHSASPASS